MRRPGIIEISLGALAGAAVGSTGSLFAADFALAITEHRFALLFSTPKISLLSWVIGGVCGWLAGGQIGPRIGEKFNSPKAEILSGGVAGLIPVILIASWGWYMVTR
jgi:hypothetical protein